MSAETARLLTLWGIDPSSTLVPLERGESNQTFRVGSAGGSYVLRIHGDPAIEPVRFEHDLLHALARLELPFATPVPVPLLEGGTIAVVDTGHGPRAAALFRWIRRGLPQGAAAERGGTSRASRPPDTARCRRAGVVDRTPP